MIGMSETALVPPLRGWMPASPPVAAKATLSPGKVTFPAAKSDMFAAQGDSFAPKVTVLRPKVTVFGVFGCDLVRCVNTPSARPAGRACAARLGKSPKVSYIAPADVEFCDGLRCQDPAHPLRRPSLDPDGDFLSIDDPKHDPRARTSRPGPQDVLERNTSCRSAP
jgi:hypothetical protein